ncbi:hypothetical protein MMMB2_4880 [Mycobacterium marinum MB2]|nr:hypothetical protein MMMB2_4880 [Mycobacterium marinum MB2]
MSDGLPDPPSPPALVHAVAAFPQPTGAVGPSMWPQGVTRVRDVFDAAPDTFESSD